MSPKKILEIIIAYKFPRFCLATGKIIPRRTNSSVTGANSATYSMPGTVVEIIATFVRTTSPISLKLCSANPMKIQKKILCPRHTPMPITAAHTQHLKPFLLINRNPFL